MDRKYLYLIPLYSSSLKEGALVPLQLHLIKDGRSHGQLPALSGQPGAQRFRRADSQDSYPGSLEPIPEGVYVLAAPLWANSSDHHVFFSPALGPVWVGLNPVQPMKRGSFGIHLDANRKYAPGSAGCVVLASMKEIHELLTWWDGQAPSHLVVNWELNYIDRKKWPADLGSYSLSPKEKRKHRG